MKNVYVLFVFIALFISSLSTKAQEWNTGLDIYSSYVWRGAKIGSGPAFQPYVDFSFGGFVLGANGSACASDNEAFEANLYTSYGFDFGLSISLTDYYFGSTDKTGNFIVGDYFDRSVHYFEPAICFKKGGLLLTAAYMIGDDTSDTYVEAEYSFGLAKVFVGAGNGQYTKDGGFMVCNVGLGVSKDIVITDKFSIPISGSVMLNPSTEGLFVVVGVSF